MEKQINLQYFAQFRDLRGCSGETVITRAGTAQELFEELGFATSIPVGAKWLRVAINDAFASWDDAIENGDVVVFMTPMAGG